MALAGDAPAQTARTVRIVVPYPPASGPDILSRLMAEQIGKMQGATVVIENRPGGGTMIGTQAAARAAPDGGTVLLVANSFVINPALKPGRATTSPRASIRSAISRRRRWCSSCTATRPTRA